MPLEHKNKTWHFVLWASIPAYLVAITLVWFGDYTIYFQWLLTLLLSAVVGLSLAGVRRKSEEQFVALANLVEALNMGDFSLRGRLNTQQSGQALLVGQINRLANHLASARYDFKESQLLLAKVIEQIPVVILACDQDQKVTLANPEAEKKLELPEAKLTAKTLEQLGLSALTSAQQNSVLELKLGNRQTRWHCFKDEYRDSGQPHSLFILTDLDLLLSQQEQKAWQNLVRVMSHEINNSLSPIISLTSTLESMVSSEQLDPEFSEDLQQGLHIINDRASSLKDFIQGYHGLTKISAPQKQPIDLVALTKKLVDLLGYSISLDIPETLSIPIDPVQIEQCLINLLKNAHEASEGHKDIQIVITNTNDSVQIRVLDRGTGISNPENLFVPLYSTKPQGTGIGLALSKQIVQGHQGQIRLTNREGGGCEVFIELPH